jgi:hypothetical protein
MPTDTFQLTEFSEEDILSFKPELKIGLVATVTPEGLPHVTLLTTLMASGSKQMAFGQFTEGLSKNYILQNPKTGFMIMSLDKHEWRGKATFTHTAKEGREHAFYNNIPMFRYNAYFGVHTVYYLDLVGHSGEHPLPMTNVILEAVKTMLGRTLAHKHQEVEVMNQWTLAFISKLDNLKFLAYVDSDGYPVIIPAIQAQCLNNETIVYSTGVYRDELASIPAGVPLALFAMALTMEDVLVRGEYLGIQNVGGFKQGVVKIKHVYNPMPPVPGQVYPALPMQPVEQF